MKTLPAAALTLITLAALLALPARAHQPDIPADLPPEYIGECGSCHVAYPPALLSESDWRDIMRGLDKHYGDNASLGEETRKLIEEFLARNAEPHWKAHFPSGDPPRLTSTIWYRVHHHELPDNIWQDKRVGSASNCAACHPKAEKMLFDKKNLTDVPADYGLTEKKATPQLPISPP
jgi:hypothetical protein